MSDPAGLPTQPPSIGAALEAAREAAGMSTAQVSDATRVRRSLIEAIERDDLAQCGGMVYARGHIRAMARVVGLDPEPLLAAAAAPAVSGADGTDGTDGALSTAGAAGAPTSTVPLAPPMARPTAAKPTTRRPATTAKSLKPATASAATAVTAPEPSLGARLSGTLGASLKPARTGPNWSGVMAGALALIIGVGTVQFMRSSSSATSTVVAPQTSNSRQSTATDPTAGVSAKPQATPLPTPTNSDAVAAADGVTVVVKVTGRTSWVRATTSTKTLFEGLMYKGETKTFQNKSKVKLLVGNAGAVSLRVNGRDLGAPGADGKVIKLEFLPGDPTSPQA